MISPMYLTWVALGSINVGKPGWGTLYSSTSISSCSQLNTMLKFSVLSNVFGTWIVYTCMYIHSKNTAKKPIEETCSKESTQARTRVQANILGQWYSDKLVPESKKSKTWLHKCRAQDACVQVMPSAWNASPKHEYFLCLFFLFTCIFKVKKITFHPTEYNTDDFKFVFLKVCLDEATESRALDVVSILASVFHNWCFASGSDKGVQSHSQDSES